MNFQTLDNQLDVDMQVFGTVITVEPTKYTEKAGKPFNKVNLRDDTGISRWVKIFQGNNPPMMPAQQGQRLPFKLKGGNYQGNQYYQGFWQCLNPQQEQDYNHPVPPQAPISTSAVPNYPPQQVRSPSGLKMPDTYAYPPTPESQIAMRRNIALETASRVAIGRTWNDPIGEVLNVASAFYGWLEDGKMPVDEPEQGDAPSDFQ